MSSFARKTAHEADETGRGDPATADFVCGGPAAGDFPQQIGRYRIERLLGMGGFGLVFLAHDDQLSRLVAIKVPHARRVSRPEDAAPYLREAQTVASLDHPHIVPVFDVGSTLEFPCFVVSKYIEGTNLAARLKEARYPWLDAVELAVTLAEALHYAHTQGLVHRDVKPGNILIDRQGRPFLVDFGLALREQDTGQNLSYAGTPAYMSPEQARGEGHRVDGRSDMFSLGVVLYELLTGRRPFQGSTRDALLAQITTHEPKPPRQIADSIPRELERICLRALAKRATDRYTTALDFADDLRHLLSQALPSDVDRQAALRSSGVSLPGGAIPPLAAIAGTTFPSISQVMRVVPKGLRSFDEHDADFFLELLPGPRDRNGLPDSIRFWKSRIEENNFERTFTAGLIYGPSGCGKSSLVKAGLLPRLSEKIVSLYIESTPDETEHRLLNKLRKSCPTLPADLGLKESLLAVRRGHEALSGRKLLIVIDQFEQWLHARKGDDSGGELVQALRQCDGVQVQCLVLVRDDFYVAVNRFFQQLEVPILEGHNYSLVDLFDLDHARKVLIAFGRAHGRLPESSATLTDQQQDFLCDSVAGLAQERKVISVRLALFAEMMKGRTWTPASLREVGGPEGVGVTFLEETFAAQTAPPTHRLHQPAVRAVLKALLPDAGTDIKGQMQPSERLRDVSGYAARPDDFRRLLSLLENDVRLIAPAEPPDATADQSSGDAAPSPKFYQLTHDFLVPALREWLGRKQKETRRGRAELRLAERASLWSNKPERKQLPSWWEWLNIRLFTNGRAWTETERRMMRLAGRHHLMRLVVLASLGLIVVAAGIEVQHFVHRQAQSAHVHGLVSQLWKIDLKHLPQHLDELERQPNSWRQDVAEVANDSSRAPEDRTRAHLALARSDSTGLDFLRNRLLETGAAEHQVIRDELKRWKEHLTPELWQTARDAQTPAAQHLRATTALADYDPESPEWNPAIATRIVHTLVKMDPLLVNPWAEALRNIRWHLLAPLADVYQDTAATSSQRLLAASVIHRFAADDEKYLSPDLLCELVMNSDPAQTAVMLPVVRMHRSQVLGPLTDALDKAVPPVAGPQTERQIERQANAAEMLLRLERDERFWPLLKQSADPRLRTALIDRIQSSEVGWKAALTRLERESEGTIRQAIILGLDASTAGLSVDEINCIADRLADLYITDPDGGVHSAIEWVLCRWGFAERVSLMKQQLAGRPADGRKWFVNSQLQTMLIIDAPGTFKIGSPDHEPTRDGSELWRDATITHAFAISAHEVTVEQFERSGVDPHDHGGKGDRPAGFVKWSDAVRYCRWLGEQEAEGIFPEEQCYPDRYSIGPGMKLPPDYLARTGYRLPTPQEWELAARAGSQTSRFFGNSERLLERYACCAVNSSDQTSPVGQFRPNPLGLFDVYGNVSEWCDAGPSPFDTPGRQIRGGSYRATPKFLRSAMAAEAAPEDSISIIGFRIVKTLRTQSN